MNRRLSIAARRCPARAGSLWPRFRAAPRRGRPGSRVRPPRADRQARRRAAWSRRALPGGSASARQRRRCGGTHGSPTPRPTTSPPPRCRDLRPRSPTTPGRSAASRVPGGWVTKQWNFLPWEGVGTPVLPDLAGRHRRGRRLGKPDGGQAPGREGITVAVLDTGVAYRAQGSRFQRSPDFTAASSSKATTSSTATGCRSTKTATAPTSPGRSARRPTTGSASPASPTEQS